MSDPATSGRVHLRLEAYAALVRTPNLASAPPDVILGAALVALSGETVSLSTLAVAASASVLLYAGGVVLNDYFDAPIDARERPDRPIPAGQVPRRTAGAIGGTLLAGGVGLALVVGPWTVGVAALLVFAIILYDGVLKDSIGGFLAMGSTRTLNVFLGMVAVGNLGTVPSVALVVPIVVGCYIALVTFMAVNEATETRRSAVAAGAGGVVLAAMAVVSTVALVRPGLIDSVLSLCLVAGFLAWTGRALGAAYADPRPETVGSAVGTCVLALVVLDAAFAAVAGVSWAIFALSFLVPALVLSRVFAVS